MNFDLYIINDGKEEEEVNKMLGGTSNKVLNCVVQVKFLLCDVLRLDSSWFCCQRAVGWFMSLDSASDTSSKKKNTFWYAACFINILLGQMLAVVIAQ